MEQKNKELLIKDTYEQCIQYPSIEDGVKAHAETYSFNTKSELFNQLTKEQQKIWKKEIEQACISGGDAGVELARDIRYKENLEVKEVDLKHRKDKKITTKKINKPLSNLLFKLTKAEKFGFVEIPDDWEILKNNTSDVVCSCGHLIEATYFPYAFDKENNEVHYIGICPICGDFIYICD